MKTVVLQLIRAYQALTRGVATPFFIGSYSGCRSWPTCSEYALEVVARDGVVRGGVRAMRRFIHCNPLTSRSHI